MPLSSQQVAQYQARGYLTPLSAMTAEAASASHQYLQNLEESFGGRLPGRVAQKTYLLYPWVNQLVRLPAVLDAVESILGPNVLCWGTQFFIKEPHDPSFVSWHQDGTYWGLSSPDVVTAWIALTPSTKQSGCMKVIPSTHTSQLEHQDTFAENNLLSRGQEIAVKVDEADAVYVELQPGEFSLHHVLIHHGSAPNAADHRRVGFAVRYIAASVRKTSGERESALLVSGEDKAGNFLPEHEPLPGDGLSAHPDSVAFHAKVMDAQLANLYAGAKSRGKLK